MHPSSALVRIVDRDTANFVDKATRKIVERMLSLREGDDTMRLEFERGHTEARTVHRCGGAVIELRRELRLPICCSFAVT